MMNGGVSIEKDSSLLAVRDVTRSFGGIQALRQVSFDIPHGHITGIIGPNGAGKTTIFNVVTGAYAPDTGDIVFDGHHIDGRHPADIARAGIARTFQNIRLFSSMTVWEHLLVAQPQDKNPLKRLLPISWADKSVIENAEQTLESFGLQGVRNRLAASLPYGIQRKVEMARAMTSRPKLLLLDEPVAGMTHEETENLRRLLIDLSKTGLSILLIEHDMNFVMNLCQSLYVLDFGRMIANGAPDQVRVNPAVLDAYLGEEDA